MLANFHVAALHLSHASGQLMSCLLTDYFVRERTCETKARDENSSFIFTVCFKSVPLYQFKLVYVVPHI